MIHRERLNMGSALIERCGCASDGRSAGVVRSCETEVRDVDLGASR